MAELRNGPALHGWLIIDKPAGPGSTQVVGAVKRALREGGYAKVKVGHGGTLDPLASGVLPVALGEATKLAGRMLDSDKIYEFTIGFGVETDTLDEEGAVVATSDARPTLAEIEAVLPRFTGAIEQLPPAYSALKIDGKAAYARARAGETVAMKPRNVTVHALKILPELARGGGPRPQGVVEGQMPQATRSDGAYPSTIGDADGPPPRDKLGEKLDRITLSAHVSKGTYVRSLARDIAHALETVGRVTMLRRIKAGPFGLSPAISLDKLAGLAKARRLEEAILPLTAGLDDIPALSVTSDQARRLRMGQLLIGATAQPGLHIAIADEVPVALVEVSEHGVRVVRGFNMDARPACGSARNKNKE